MKFLISHWQNQSYKEVQSNENKEDGLQDIWNECVLKCIQNTIRKKMKGLDQLAGQT